MTKREKTLTAAVAAAGLLWFGNSGLIKYRAALDRNSGLSLAAAEALGDAKFAEARGLQARRKLNDWRGKSLPTNREVAKSLYQDWLREQLTAAGLEVSALVDKSATARNTHFSELAVDVTAAGTLAQLADFLYKFYASAHLHRIASATITADAGGQKLTIALTVGALILPDVSRTDQLAAGEPLTLPRTADEFRQRLADRNLFATPQAKSEGGDQADPDAAGAKVTSLATDSLGWRLAVRNKDSEMQFFRQGDSVKFGRFEGKIVELGRQRAVIETEKGNMEVRLGQNFGEAAAVDAPAAAAPAADSSPASAEAPAEAASETPAA